MKLNQAIVTKPYTKFGRANSYIVGKEIQVQNTICFISNVNLTEIEKIRSSSEVKPSYTAFVVKALSKAIIEFPHMNRRTYHWPFLPFLLREQIFASSDVTVAVERFINNEPAAVYAEVIRNPFQSSLQKLTQILSDLANSTLESNQQWADYHKMIMTYPFLLGPFLANLPCYFPQLWTKYRGGVAMVSSPAKYGVDQMVGWWTHPVGVSFGYVEKKAVVIEDKIEIVKMFSLSLNWDRRLMGGAQAAQFFNRFVEILENAESELNQTEKMTQQPQCEIAVSGFWSVMETFFSVGKRNG